MEKKDRRTECDLFLTAQDGMSVVCAGKALSECPKSRNRLIITSACWRVHNKVEQRGDGE